MSLTLLKPVPNYTTSPLIDLTDRAERERLSDGAVRAFFNIMDKWQISDTKARVLLGGISNGTFYTLKKGQGSVLDEDRIRRISYLVGIFKALNILYSEALADQWITRPNKNRIFAGKPALDYMMRGGQPAFQTVRPFAGCAARRAVSLPSVSEIRQNDTHHLVPSKFSDNGESVLMRIADDDAHLATIFDLDHVNNDRLLAENNLLPGIGTDELVFGVPFYRMVNAAFCHASPDGARFNGPDRGAWYAGFEVEVSQAEVAFHKSVELAEVDWWQETVTYDDYLADFGGPFHDIRGADEFADCLSPDSYVAAQTLGERLLSDGAAGVLYPSVRAETGDCIACFRPAMVANVRKSTTNRFTWDGVQAPVIEEESP